MMNVVAPHSRASGAPRRGTHVGMLAYRRSRYLWWSLGLIGLSSVVYLSQGSIKPASGGTWQGYVLGTLGAALVVWLSLLGLRKRLYGSRLATLQGWTSAHVYLGSSLLVIVTLHCAFQFGWNIHTLAYALMCAVILSGAYGVYAYVVQPHRLSVNRARGSRERMFEELFELDRRGRSLARQCEPEIEAVVASSIARTQLGGGVLAQLFAIDRSRCATPVGAGSHDGATLTSNHDQSIVIGFVADHVPRAIKHAEAANLQDLLSLLSRRQMVLRRIRRDIQLQGWLRVWLYVHVPLTVALWGALAAHVVSTFVYW